MPEYLSTDPNAGEPVEGGSAYLSTDPNAGDPVEDPSNDSSWGTLGKTLLRPDQTLLGAGKAILRAGYGMTAGATGNPMPPAFESQNPTQEGGATALNAAASMYGGGAGLAAAGRAVAGAVKVPGVVGAVGRWAAAHPTAAAAVGGAVPGVLAGDLRGAATGAALGAAGVKGVSGLVGKVLPRVAKPIPPKAPTPAAAPRAAAATPAKNTPIRKAAAPKKAPKADPEPTPKILDKSAAAAADHQARVAFAKEVAAKNPKVGEKIWMELDAKGTPVRALTPDQAAAAKRRGAVTYWIRNHWS